jgi:hypothetical protein
VLLTEVEYEFLRAGRVQTVHGNRATLTVFGEGQDARFLMKGPSGEHTLLVEATNLHRLNSHWVVFANHSLNRISV